MVSPNKAHAYNGKFLGVQADPRLLQSHSLLIGVVVHSLKQTNYAWVPMLTLPTLKTGTDTRTNSVGPDGTVHNELSLQDLQFAALRWFVYARGDNSN